jgi:hypothetical protein
MNYRSSLALVLLGLTLVGCESYYPPPAVADGRDFTFFVAGDAHIGAAGMEPANRKLVEQLNALPGTAYPQTVGGSVAAPVAVLYTGDMTDNGAAWEWGKWKQLYGSTGKDGLLKYPVLEASGNHDRLLPLSPVPANVARRHGDSAYSWDWGKIHFVCLDLYPDARKLRWLEKDLAGVGQWPVVIYFHYTFFADFAIVGEDWSANEKAAFAEALQGHNIALIFCGHWHIATGQKWCGHDVFQAGSPRHNCHTFLVVHVRDNAVTICLWDWEHGCWAGQPVQKRI